MSESRFKRPKLWRANPETPEAVVGFESKDSRQQRRARLRKSEWEKFSGERALRDDGGIIARRVRRDIARLQFQALWQYQNGRGLTQ